MPPRESTSRPPRSNVYSVLLIVSAVFLLLASLVLVSEKEPEVMLTASNDRPALC